MVDKGEYCDECGFYGLTEVGEVKNTKSFKCAKCFTEKIKFIDKDSCDHEYDERNPNTCFHCGEQK